MSVEIAVAIIGGVATIVGAIAVLVSGIAGFVGATLGSTITAIVQSPVGA